MMAPRFARSVIENQSGDRMNARKLLTVAVLVLAAPASAQTVNPKCLNAANNAQNSKYVEDACQKALDLFGYMFPQLGLSLVGGNTTLGVGGTLGGFPHFSIGLRGNVFNGSLPQVDAVTPSSTGAQQSIYPTKDQILGLPAVDAAIGIFKGIPMGLTNVGGIDLLVSAFYIPEVNENEVQVTVSDGSLKLGWGARIGILQESALMPGLSFSYLQRDLPTVDLEASAAETTGGADLLSVNNFNVKTKVWRVTASKSLLLFGVVLGVGRDKYEGGADVSVTVQPRLGGPLVQTTGGPVAIRNDMTRTNYFADFSFNLPIVKIIAEIGQVRGGVMNTYNFFDGAQPNATRTYGSAGLRLSF
jgi:hypothetical protein